MTGFTLLLRPYTARLSALSGRARRSKIESGGYVKRNALAGRRFTLWEDLNSWLERWSVQLFAAGESSSASFRKDASTVASLCGRSMNRWTIE